MEHSTASLQIACGPVVCLGLAESVFDRGIHE